MSKSDRDALSSSVLQKLFQAPADAEDVQKERNTGAQVTPDLTLLHDDVLEGDETTQAPVEALANHQ